MVVGRLDVVGVDEGPECGLVLQDVGARAGHLRDAGEGRLVEQLAHLLFHWSHPRGERRAIELAGLVVVPIVEDDGRVVEELSAERARGAVALGERDELSDQMRPTNLPALHRPEGERLGAVADHDSGQRAVERLQRRLAAIGDDPKDGGRRGRDRP